MLHLAFWLHVLACILVTGAVLDGGWGMGLVGLALMGAAGALVKLAAWVAEDLDWPCWVHEYERRPGGAPARAKLECQVIAMLSVHLFFWPWMWWGEYWGFGTGLFLALVTAGFLPWHWLRWRYSRSPRAGEIFLTSD